MISGNRERLPRRAVRLPVRFWRQGASDQVLSGFTTNVSAGGMFISTWKPLRPNALVELEIEHPSQPVRTTARVVHAARYPAQFAKVFKSGMGLRFCRPEDSQVATIAQMGQLLADRGGRRRFTR